MIDDGSTAGYAGRILGILEPAEMLVATGLQLGRAKAVNRGLRFAMSTGYKSVLLLSNHAEVSRRLLADDE